MNNIKGSTIYPNTTIGKGTILEEGAIIGLPSHGKSPGEIKTIIGKNSHIRAHTIIHAGVKIGDNFQSGPYVFIRENNIIGNNVCIWANTVLNPDNKIGDGTRIHVGCFLECATIGKLVFIAPHVTFTDDPHPTNPPIRMHMKGATVGNKVIIGGGTTLLPYVKIGDGAFIGAGSVVTKNVPPEMLYYGNPAKQIKPVVDIKCNKTSKIHYPYKEK